MERKWILSAFVDLNGFGTWIYRATIPKEVKEPFLEGYLGLVQEYVRDQKGVHFKYLGDGFLAIKEFSPEDRKNGVICDFVKGLKSITQKIGKLIKECEDPPTGVRVRITSGYAYKVMVVDASDPTNRRHVPEYIEYSINTAERLMEVNPEIICLVTDGVGKALGHCRSTFGMRELGTPSCYPKSVNKEDLETLKILRF